MNFEYYEESIFIEKGSYINTNDMRTAALSYYNTYHSQDVTYACVWGRPWYNGSELDCWSTSRVIDPASEHDS